MRFFNRLKTLPPFIRCLLAFRWLAHNTFLRSPPFHLANLSSHPLLHVEGVRQAGGGIHQGIARHRGLAKDGPPDLIRRDEPSTGALPSNAILRFEKTTHAYHFQRPKMSRTRWVALL